MQEQRLGFVGLGGMGSSHASNFRQLGASVVAGADVMLESRKTFASEFGADVYENHEEMYKEEELDGVIIATPNRFHADAATAALRRDIHVLCEKPLADTLPNAERIVKADSLSSAFCMVGFSKRFCGSASLFKDLQKDEMFGEIEHVQANMLRRRGIPGLGSWFTNKELSGGGALVDIGVHAIDFALYLAGYPEVTEVIGTIRDSQGKAEDYADPEKWGENWDTSNTEFNVDDSVSAFLLCENGTSISIEVAWASNRDSSKEVLVSGTDAGAQLEIDGDDLHILKSGTSEMDYHEDRKLTGELEPSSHLAEDQTFLHAIQNDTRPEINHISEGFVVQKVMDAIYESSETGTSVQLEDSSSIAPDQSLIK
ncbi:Gfo/Idh/MocA family oxidoreductase [Halomontanus rarus]|uniref:Gfo/Idh/MocA family protein n=1 Tax=Halomontanus rarus TaxID=3034020 RepID=UPI00293C039F|nr:Gfo/Idh/MocA family oxidoreductase [Halovivax sp. KZCA124]